MSTPVISQTRDMLQVVYEWIDEVLARHYSSYYITLNDEFNIIDAGTFPVVVISYNESRVEDVVYGRIIKAELPSPNYGSMISLPLTLYLYEIGNREIGEDFDRDCQILVRRIIDWLRSKNQNTTEMTDHGIWYVHPSPDARRSPPNILEVSRYILYVDVIGLREDNPLAYTL